MNEETKIIDEEEPEEKSYRVDATLHFIAYVDALNEEDAREKFFDGFTEWPGELLGDDLKITEG